MRRILYLSGTRADYGLMRRTLFSISRHSELELGIVVTGMHLDPLYGETVQEIEGDGLRIAGRIATHFGSNESFMARAIAATIKGCCEILERERPDMLMLLGDRGEMLAGAIAALHLNIPIVHIHGGERSGTVDEPVRHAISKLAHIHLTATDDAAQRLVRMGERSDSVFCVGAPGLDGLESEAIFSKKELLEKSGIAEGIPIALMIFHPVVQNANDGPRQVAEIISALRKGGFAIVGLRPNADFGGDAIRNLLDTESGSPDFKLYTHFPRQEFISWMAVADVMIGNSSAGIIEAASFGTPVINVGSRQNLRERNANVLDSEADEVAILSALDHILEVGRFPCNNIYGDGDSASRITDLLANIDLPSSLLDKACAY